jgi:glycosyltransferase involved in cell wall biosynthesis
MTKAVVDHPLRILQVNTADLGGGAEKVAWELLQAYRKRGHDSWLAVGRKSTDDPQVVKIPNEENRSKWVQEWRRVQASLHEAGYPRVSRCASWLGSLGELHRRFDLRRGIEDFHFPGTAYLLQCPPHRPDVVHGHNLHGWYFDLRHLALLSRDVPVVLTLHDAWLLSGHCAYPYECERWRMGCGTCPDLKIYPAIQRDGTAHTWRRKRSIFARSRVYVATPSRWLMQKLEESMLAPAVVERRVIPNGVDLSVFRPGDRHAARQAVGISGDVTALLCVASGIQREMRKGYHSLRDTVALISERLPQRKILLLALGESASGERIGRVEVRFLPYQKEAHAVARFYQAADLYVHPALADNFPLTVLEALACGLPVVATAVGGIPEQVKSVRTAGAIRGYEVFSDEQATGILTPAGDAESMAGAIISLFEESALRIRLGANAARDAGARFDLQTQVERYLTWYMEILDSRQAAEQEPLPV